MGAVECGWADTRRPSAIASTFHSSEHFFIIGEPNPLRRCKQVFYAVGIWNDFFHALLYINDSAKWPLQMVLRQVTILSDLTAANGDMVQNTVPPEQGIKLAVIVIATIPILAVYPFLQKHFAKGILIGSVKG